MESYFEQYLGKWDNISRCPLDLLRRSHGEKFCKVIEEKLNIFGIENTIEEIKNRYLTKQ